MGIYINQHFYSELFEEKRVNNHQKLYLLLFNTIWPQPKNFELFLSSSETSLKLEYAKKIYENFSFINDIFMPSFTILNVLDDQYNNFIKHSEGYVPQDHVIHSIYTYILGIYLFFNSEKISKKFLKINTNKHFYDLVKDFILKWQLFSLYHDVGYYFENRSLSQKNTHEYINIFNDVLKHVISKHISKVVTFKALTEKHSSIFNITCVEQSTGIWYDNSGNRISKAKVKDSVKNFIDTICIEAITNDEELNLFLPLLGNQHYLVSVHNEDGTCIALIIRKNLEIKKVFLKSNAPSDLLLNNILNTSSSKYVFQYFLPGIHSEAFWLKAIDEPVVINDIYSQLPQDLTSDISINNNSVLDILFKVNNWLSEKLTYDSFLEKQNHEKDSTKCLKESFLKICKDILEQIIQEQCSKSNLSEQTFNIISSTFKTNKKEAYNEIISQTNELYRKHFATTHRFVEYCSEQFEELSQTSSLLESVEKLTVFETDDEDHIKFHPFSYDKGNHFHSTLFNNISKLSDPLGTSIEQLLKYHPPYVQIDHSIFSSCLLFQIVCFLNDTKKYCFKNSRLLLAWTPLIEEENKLLTFSSEVIFAILIHNIYNKQSTPSFGVSYCHNIDINPFSYFGAFCDTLQKWGRPKKSNLSKTQLPNTNYLEDEFDIEILNGNITIRCLKSNTKETMELIQNSELFLPGISNLVEVKEI